MWILYMTIAIIVLTLAQIPSRVLGLTMVSYAILALSQLSLTSWLIPLSYAKAPTFFQPWVYSIGLLSIGGVVVSTLYFREVISTVQWIGLGLTALGSILLCL